MFRGRLTYSYPSMGVTRKKLLMSQHMKRSSGVEMVPSSNNFAAFRAAICVMTYPVYLMRLPPTVRRVQYGSYFGGNNPQQSAHMQHFYFYFQIHCCVTGRKLSLWLPTILQLTEIACLSNWKRIWSTLVCVLNFYELYVLHGDTCVLTNGFIGYFGYIVVLCHRLVVFDIFSWR